ncbi:hypervirulence associated TUDOR domain-containing protein [Adhaeretor mobilis]|uniref:Hypervirulence associated protein TUDOR domain-containing protein n=1 Tax=Adhaeretor mobilis TaxID=1930276 RepID=A0A517MSR6_9BACT|nr:DUF2945 domain-containing protein [Adhaeretor mobilis]QDS97928.1 hypothetical protein HG15A2_11960 [Adhaeretor mobilis]
MAESFSQGTKVKWKWGNGYGHARVEEKFTERITCQIKGTKVTRNATQENPAYLLEQDDGSLVLKSHSELEEA